jgi:hypothetical protein
MRKLFLRSFYLIVFCIAWFATVPNTHAALYAGWGTLANNKTGPDFSLCFAGDAVDVRADRVLNVLDHIRHIEWAANIKFHPPGNKSIRIQSGQTLDALDWRCPNTSATNGSLPQGDLGDVRILLHTAANNTWWTTDPVGGHDCAIINHGSSWGATGNEPRLSNWCNFSVKLGDDPIEDPATFYLNHTLHEVAHKLGLGHEHNRSDATCAGGTVINGSISSATDPSGTSINSQPQIFMTAPFDTASVTNYVLTACGTKGNYDFTGYSAHDALALRVLYPENTRVAEIYGTRVIKSGQRLVLGNLWQYLGASVDTSSTSVANNFSWKLNGTQKATAPNLNINIGEGIYSLVYTYQDFLKRSYSFNNKVEVLSATQFDRRMASQAVIIGAVY